MRESLKWDYTLQQPTRLSISFRGYAYNFITLQEAAFMQQQMRSTRIMADELKESLLQLLSLCTPTEALRSSSSALSSMRFTSASDTSPSAGIPVISPREKAVLLPHPSSLPTVLLSWRITEAPAGEVTYSSPTERWQGYMELLRSGRGGRRVVSASEVQPTWQAVEKEKAGWQEEDPGTPQKSIRGL